MVLTVPTAAVVVVSLAGMAICFAWFTHMQSFQALFGAKLETLRKVEERLGLESFTAFTTELDLLRNDHPDGYVRFTFVDMMVSWIFFFVFVAFIIINMTA